MIKSTEEYLDQLKVELQDSDVATIQDALSDAEEHLRLALANLKQEQPEMSEVEALGQVIEQYGSPDEIASAYKEVERLTRPSSCEKCKSRNPWESVSFRSLPTRVPGEPCFTCSLPL